MWAQHWDILQSFLMRAVISFPHTIDYVARVLSWTKRKGENIDTQWRGALLVAFKRNSNLGNDSEVCWLLWCMSELELDIPDELIDVLLARCGAFPIVMFLHITRTGRRRRRRFSKVLRDAVVDRIGPNPFMGPYWLLAHEAVNSKWLDIANLDQTDLSPFMREFQVSSVSFYDREARPLSIREDEFGDEEEPFAIEDMAGRYDDDDDYFPEDNDIPV